MNPNCFEPGIFVRARGRTWLIESIDGKSRELAHQRVICVDDDAQGEMLELCLNAELSVELPSADPWSDLVEGGLNDSDVLSAHLNAVKWNSATATDRTLFQAPFRAGIRLDPYQLLPLKKALELPRVNLLIADDVGLGKTVEAGLIARELLLRRRVDRIVVSAPASMVSQWQDEMAQKFGLDFRIIDREYLLETRRERGFASNPWALGSRFIISHDLLRNETYADGLRTLLGEFAPKSLLILDEAHHAAPSGGLQYAVESQFTRAVRDMAGRFEHRLFLSATPHNGHSSSFSTLLEILDPQRFTRGISVQPRDLAPIMVRRLKADLRALGHAFPERRIEPIVIDGLSTTAPELVLAEMLAAYRDTAADSSNARFLFAQLQQRLFSSIAAFARTLETHRQTLLKNANLDFAEDQEDIERAGRKAAPDLGGGSLAQVDAMLAIAKAAGPEPDARIERLLDWLSDNMRSDGDWNGRRVILFTEWTDTCRWLVRQLEEGLLSRFGNSADIDGRIEVFTGDTDSDTRDDIKRRFNADPEKHRLRILVCTDAAREGINLQTRCHDLFHIDLPWNPARLEQRNGRIDRKLQPSAFVTCRYFLYAQREEDLVLDALVRKSEIIRQQLGAAGQVLQLELDQRLNGEGIRRGASQKLANEIEALASPRANQARAELGDGENIQALKMEETALRTLLEQARRKVGVDPDDLKRALQAALKKENTALVTGDYSVPDALSLDPLDQAFQKDRTWQPLFDELRVGTPPRGRYGRTPSALRKWREETPVRGLSFTPPKLEDGRDADDVVQLHLEHRLVRRLMSRFISRGFAEALKRVTVVEADVERPMVALIGRIALFGPQAVRLHEEVVPVVADWLDRTKDSSATLIAHKASDMIQLEEYVRSGKQATDETAQRLSAHMSLDVEQLKSILLPRAEEAKANAASELMQVGERESEAIGKLLAEQAKRLNDEIVREQGLQREMVFDREEEQQQRQRDRAYWDEKIERLRAQAKTEPRRVREKYVVQAERIEPIALIYLTPKES